MNNGRIFEEFIIIGPIVFQVTVFPNVALDNVIKFDQKYCVMQTSTSVIGPFNEIRRVNNVIKF